MAIYNTCVATRDETGKVWKTYVRIRGISMNHAMNKATKLVESVLGTDSHASAAWNCPHQTGVHVIGNNGRLMSVSAGKLGSDLVFSYGREIVVKNGRWSTISELDATRHDYVVSRVWDKC